MEKREFLYLLHEGICGGGNFDGWMPNLLFLAFTDRSCNSGPGKFFVLLITIIVTCPSFSFGPCGTLGCNPIMLMERLEVKLIGWVIVYSVLELSQKA